VNRAKGFRMIRFKCEAFPLESAPEEPDPEDPPADTTEDSAVKTYFSEPAGLAEDAAEVKRLLCTNFQCSILGILSIYGNNH